MHFIIKLWNQIAYLGLTDKALTKENRQVILGNQIAVLAFIAAFIFEIIFIMTGLVSIAKYHIIVLLVYTSIPVINYYQKYLAAKIFFNVSVTITLVVFSTLFRNKLGISMYFFPQLFAIFVLFDFKEIKKIIFHVSLIFISVLYLHSPLIDHFPSIQLPVSTQERLYLHSLLTSLILSLLFAYYLLSIYLESEKELKAAKEKAEKASQTKDQFLSTISHELRTPLNSVIGTTHLLEEESTNPEQREYLNTLKFSAQNLLALINDILDFSKIEAGRIDFEVTEFSIYDLLKSIYQAHQHKAEQNQNRLTYEVDESIPRILIGDPTRLSQILNNLVSNAVKFTENGSVHIHIKAEKQNVNNITLHFSVQDTGIGIKRDEIPRIFEAFSQIGSNTTRQYGGTGLGLSITRQLLQLQNSDIRVSSQPGKGTTFNFDLSFKVSNNQELKTRWSEKEAIQFKSLEGAKVLIAEDNKMNMMLAEKFLAKWDMTLDTAENGLEAFEKVLENEYHLILMDLQMPEMDGYQATREIRNMPGEFYKNIPIIALTASVTQDIKDKVFTFGMNDYISKPFNPEELYQKIRNHLENNHFFSIQ